MHWNSAFGMWVLVVGDFLWFLQLEACTYHLQKNQKMWFLFWLWQKQSAQLTSDDVFLSVICQITFRLSSFLIHFVFSFFKAVIRFVYLSIFFNTPISFKTLPVLFVLIITNYLLFTTIWRKSVEARSSLGCLLNSALETLDF